MKKITRYVMIDILRSRIVIGYMAFLLALSLGIFTLEDNSTKGLLSLLNIILFIVPLICIIFSTIYLYNSAEFIELLVSQPLKRKTIWLSMFLGLSVSLALAFLIGAGIPVLLFAEWKYGITLMLTGLMLSIIFVALAMLASVGTRDKARGIGKAILAWLYFSILFDGLVLFILFQFADYPLEKPMVLLSMLNPIDLGRILILLQLDISALMGYTGAVFRDFFGNASGICIAAAVLLLWVLLPLARSLQRFHKKDL
jgi:Cu-processing system permease protein